MMAIEQRDEVTEETNAQMQVTLVGNTYVVQVDSNALKGTFVFHNKLELDEFKNIVEDMYYFIEQTYFMTYDGDEGLPL